MTAVTRRHALLYDTETALRLIDGEVRAMTGESGADAVPLVLERARTEIRAVLGSLHDGRAALDALEVRAITAQQLATAASALVALEHRLARIIELVDSVAGSGSLAVH